MAKVNPYPTSGVRRPKVNQLFAFVFNRRVPLCYRVNPLGAMQIPSHQQLL